MRERVDTWWWGLPVEVQAGAVVVAMLPWWWLGVVLIRGTW